MMNKDDILLKQFFADHKQEIADNGFSQRVMHRLPDRQQRLAHWWSLFCFMAGLIWFTLVDGWNLLWGTLQGVVADISTATLPEVEPQTILVLLIALICLGYRKIISLV